MGAASVGPSAAEAMSQPMSASSSVNRPSIWHRLGQRWSDLQIGRQGSYSVERLESLANYCKTTSRTRAILVCVLTPLPALTTAVLLECLPLRPRSEGWKANWMFWIRLSLMVFIICFVGISELITFLPDLHFTVWKRLVVALGTSAGFMIVCLLVADTIGFPVPNTWQSAGVVEGILLPMMILLVFGTKPFARNSRCRKHLQRFIRFLFAYMAFGLTFPLCKVLYDFVPAVYQSYAAVVVLVWRLAAENFIVRATRELEDFIPAIIAFSVDLLATLFVSVCISSSPPIKVSALFIAVDVGQLLLEFREVNAHTNTVAKALRSQHPAGEGGIAQTTGAGGLLRKLVAVTRDPGAFQLKSLKDVRLWACLPHPLGRDQTTQLYLLEASGIYECKAIPSRRRSRARVCRHPAKVGPQSTAIVATSNRAEPHLTTSPQSVLPWKAFVLEGLQLLFYCECLLLIEYVECVVPLLLVVYKAILRFLPNAIYYPNGVGIWGTSELGNTLAFAALEAASLLLLLYFLQRRFSFSPLHQLAFVLETQMYVIQASLFLEIVVQLQYELSHLGVDFTFRFDWLRDQ